MEIIIGGDTYLGKEAEYIAENHPSELWGNAINALHNCDFRIINLESPLTNSNRSIVKTGPNIKANPKVINALLYANINLVTLANNHILDYGQEGLDDTFSICKQNNIDFVGAGKTLEEAQSPYYKVIKNQKLGIINIAENEWASANPLNGGANPMNIIDNVNQIKKARSEADFVIVIIHGGHEYFQYPSPRMVKQYRFYVDQGADAVVAHHTHCVSGYEIYNKAPIFYSLGNLLFPSNTSFKPWYRGMFVKLNFDKQFISFDLIPFFQFINQKCGLQLMDGTNKTNFINELNNSINPIIEDHEKLSKKWEEFASNAYQTRLMDISGKRTLFYRFLKRLNLLPLALNKNKLNLLLNLFRCEAHRDLSIKVLEKFNKR